jgi:hypothetical protein
MPETFTGLPHPDGSQRIRKAIAEENFARQAYIEAMARLNRFLLDGKIPDDILVKLGRKTDSAEKIRPD